MDKSAQEGMDLLDEAYSAAVQKGVPCRIIKPNDRPKPPWMSDHVLKLTKMCQMTHLNMKNWGSWYAFMTF